MRISGEPPKLVGKKIEGSAGSPEAMQAELLKHELQRFLRSLAEASDQAQVDIDDLLNGRRGGSQSLHGFFLMGG